MMYHAQRNHKTQLILSIFFSKPDKSPLYSENKNGQMAYYVAMLEHSLMHKITTMVITTISSNSPTTEHPAREKSEQF